MNYFTATSAAVACKGLGLGPVAVATGLNLPAGSSSTALLVVCPRGTEQRIEDCVILTGFQCSTQERVFISCSWPAGPQLPSSPPPVNSPPPPAIKAPPSSPMSAKESPPPSRQACKMPQHACLSSGHVLNRAQDVPHVASAVRRKL
jgi:hypothetical protein